MSDREGDLKKLNALKHKGECTVNWFEEGGGIVYKIEDMFILFYVFGYGINSNYEKTYSQSELDELLDKAYSWT